MTSAENYQPTSNQDTKCTTEIKSGEEKVNQGSDWAERILKTDFFNTNSEKKESKWGYDLYPERKQLFQSTISKIIKMQEGREQFDKMKCEENVFQCVKSSPLVKTMMGALKSAGWLVVPADFFAIQYNYVHIFDH